MFKRENLLKKILNFDGSKFELQQSTRAHLGIVVRMQKIVITIQPCKSRFIMVSVERPVFVQGILAQSISTNPIKFRRKSLDEK